MAAALLDTNAVSDLMRDHRAVRARLGKHTDPVATSVVVVGEIRYGLDRLTAGKKRTDLEGRARNIFGALRIDLVTSPIAATYGHLKASLEKLGRALDDNDLWIAATAVTHGSLVVSRDRSFLQVPGLQVEDWTV